MIIIFWENITRYPRFLITNISGLIIIILGPFLKLAKKSLVSQLTLLLFFILTLISFAVVLNEMLNL